MKGAWLLDITVCWSVGLMRFYCTCFILGYFGILYSCAFKKCIELLTCDLCRTFSAYSLFSLSFFTFTTSPKAPFAIVEIMSKSFWRRSVVMGNSGKNIDSMWATGQAVLLASNGLFNVESFHLKKCVKDKFYSAAIFVWKCEFAKY